MQPTYPSAHPTPGLAVAPAPASRALDPFAKVRSLGATAIVLLAMRASMRVLTYGAFRILGAAGVLRDIETARTIDTILLGLENVVGLVAMIVFLVWIHAVFVALRNAGTTTRTSPGMAVGGWFIPLANLVLPVLAVREALVSLRRSGGLAIGWWLVWLVNIPLFGLHQLFRQMALVPEVGRLIPAEHFDKLIETLDATFWPMMVCDTLAWALLAVVVATVRRATEPTS